MTVDELALRLAKPYDSFDGTGSVQAITPIVPRPSKDSGKLAALRIFEGRGEASYRSLNTPSTKGWAA